MKSRYLSDSEIEKLFSALDDTGKLLFGICRETGLRIGDVVKIRRQDIRYVPNIGNVLTYKAEKTGKTGKCVLSDEIVRACRLYGGHKFVFSSASARTGHITRQTAWNWLKNAARRSGVSLTGCSPHSLRKSFAVNIRHKQGLEAARIALQHSDSAVTAIYAYADVYGGFSPDEPVTWAMINQLVDLVLCEMEYRRKKEGNQPS